MKKALNIIEKTVTAIIVAFTVFVMIFTVISFNTVGNDRMFLGYKPYIVLSDSMSGVFEVGDIVVSKQTEISELKEGDTISFRSMDPDNYDAVVTHKIKGETEYEGEKAFVTYGVSTGVEDEYSVPADRVVGKYQFRLPKMGYFFQFLKTPMGYFIFIFLPFMLLIGSEAVRFYKLWKQYKEEQAAILEEQRTRSEEMQEEIKRLKAQLAEKEKKNRRVKERAIFYSPGWGNSPVCRTKFAC